MPLSHCLYQDHLRGKKWFGDDAELSLGRAFKYKSFLFSYNSPGICAK